MSGLLSFKNISQELSKLQQKDLGFIELSAGQDPIVDIVAIHGLDGDREGSWVADNGTMWLKDILPRDFPSARILSYGYDADTHRFSHTSTQTIFRHAEAFAEDLSRARRANPERPIIFLAHSLGGIILKKALAHCHTDSFESSHRLRDITTSTLAVLFFGTPHSGANGVELAKWMHRLLALYMHTNDTVLQDLGRDSPTLEEIQAQYLRASVRFNTIFFYEEYPTPLFGGLSKTMVPRNLAIIAGDRDAKVVVLHADHCQMVKFTDANDQNYRKVIDYLPELLDRGPARVRENWIRERSHRSIATGVLPPSQTAVLTKPLPPVSKSYIQRADISIFLTRRLLPPTPGEHQPRCVLHGSSGSGKTQLAVAWIEVHKDRFNMIIVIDASSRQQIETDLQTAIRSVGPQYNKATWKDAVAYLSREVNWLLFFDNADEPNLSLDRYLPNSRSGAVLVTTRNRDYATYAPDGHVEVEALTEKQAMDLLHKIIGTSPPSTSASLAIVRELEMWPLSVTQAGLYIRTSHLDTYLADLRMHRDELRQATSLEGNDHLWSKYAAFNLSFAQLPKKSQEWMKICAFLRHSSIPLSLFRSSNRVEFRAPTIMITQPPLDDDELAISRLRGIFGSDWDNSSFQQLVDPISRTSFIDTSDNDGQSFYKIHSLVQLFIQDLLGPADRERYALLASQLVLGTIRPLEGGESNIWYRQILPHIEALPMRAKTSHISHALAYHMVYKSVGNWDATQQLEKHCCDHFYQRYGPTYPGTLDMMGSLATTFRHRGQLEEAEKLGREVLQRRTEIVGLKHSDTILSMNNLSLTLSARGKLREAEEMKRKVLELRKETSGPDHPDTIAAMGNYASALHSRGALREAEKIEREVVELRKRTGGLQDLTTIIAMRNLALTLKKLDQLEDAEKMMREVLALLEVALGPRHLETMKAKSGLATMLQSAPQLEEAEKLEREVLEFQAEELGERHPDTMTTMHNLAVTLHHRGDLVGSEKMTRHVLRLQMDVLGPRNADTILTMSTLGFILHRRGQWAEAEKMLREALKLRKDMFGIQNRYTIDIMSNLVVTLYCRGQLEEAEEKQRVIVAWRMENLGPRDANTIDAKSRLAKFSAELAYRIQNAAGGL